jgi:hypothetical protein
MLNPEFKSKIQGALLAGNIRRLEKAEEDDSLSPLLS